MSEFDPKAFIEKHRSEEFDPKSFIKKETGKKKDESEISSEELVSPEVESTSTLPIENELIRTAELEGKQRPPLTIQETVELERAPVAQELTDPETGMEEAIQETVDIAKERGITREEQEKQFAKETVDQVYKLSEEVNSRWEVSNEELLNNRTRLRKSIIDGIKLSQQVKKDPSLKDNVIENKKETKDLYQLVLESEDKTFALNRSKEILKKADKYYKTKDSNVLKSMFNSQYGKDFFSLGFNEMFRNFDVLAIAKKPESERTEEEIMALAAYGLNEQLMGTSEQSVSSLVGSGIATTIPFMVEFAVSGGISSTAKAGTKKYLTDLAEKQTKKYVRKAIEKLAPVAATAVEAAVKTPFLTSELLPSVPRRMIGDIQVDAGEEGLEVKVTEGEKPIEAITKSLGTTYSTALIEGFGQHMRPLLKPLTKKLPNLPMVNGITNKYINKIATNTGFNGWIPEFTEEVIEAYAHPAITGDQKLSDVWDNKQMLATFLTTGIISGSFAGANLAANRLSGERLVARENLRESESELKPETKLDIDGILKGDNVENNAEQLDRYIQKRNIDGADRQDIYNILDYAAHKTRLDALNESQALIENPAPETLKEIALEQEEEKEEKVAPTAPKTAVETKIEVEPQKPKKDELQKDVSKEITEEDGKKISDVQVREKPIGEGVEEKVLEVKEELPGEKVVPSKVDVPEHELTISRKGVEGEFVDNLEFLEEGSESYVYRDGKKVVKISEPYNDQNNETFDNRVREAIEFDKLFGTGTLRLSGRYRSKNGTLNPIFEQAFVEGNEATQEQIDSHFAEMGFDKKSDNTFEGEIEGVRYTVGDIDSDNARIVDGKLSIFDGSIINKTEIAETKPQDKQEPTEKVVEEKIKEDAKEKEAVKKEGIIEGEIKPTIAREVEEDKVETKPPKEKVPRTAKEKIAQSQSIEELNIYMVKREVSFNDKLYQARVDELRSQGMFTIDDVPANIENTEGLKEKIEYNESIEDYFKSDPGVKSAGFSFAVDNKGVKPDYLFKKYLKREGLLPKKVYDQWMRNQGRINSHVEAAQFLVKDFNKSLKSAYGKTRLGTPKVSSEQLAQINDVLQRLGKDQIERNEALSELPEQLREPTSRMRDLIDAMSTELAQSGLVEGDLVSKIQDNLGFYMTRTYRVHSDKKWNWENIPDEVKIRAAKVIKGELTDQGLINFINNLDKVDNKDYRDQLYKAFELDDNGNTSLRPDQIEATAKELALDEKLPEELRNKLTNYIVQNNAEIEGKMREMINSSDWAGAGTTTLGAKDLGVLKKRKDIPVEIRELLGEYKDPSYNFFTSVSKMANLIERHKFLEAVKVQGLGLWLHTKPTGDFSYKVAGETSPTLAPLNGLYTSEDIYKEFKQPSMESVPSWLRFYIQGISYAKYAKTILSPVTHVRNFWSNFFFQSANGRFDPAKGRDTTRVILDKIKNKDSKEFRDYYQRLIELNVVGESVSANELKNILKDTWLYQADFSEGGDNILSKKKWRAPLLKVEKAYRMEDDVHKIYAFEVEKGRYKKVFNNKYPDKTNDEINVLAEEKAAEIVRKTMPTYSELPKLIQSLNRFPLTGTFVSFPAEVIRTTLNTGKLINKELKDPETRGIGAKRMTGFILTGALTGTVSLTSRMLMGLDGDDEEDFKRFLAPWSKNSDIIMVDNKNNGKYTYIDLGFSDPHNYLKKMSNAFQSGFRGKDPGKAATDAAWELLEPFLGTDMLTARFADIYSNKQKSNGRPVYNVGEDIGEQFIDMVEYALEGIEPGGVATAQRIGKAYRNKINDFGGTSTPSNEIIGVLAGQKIQTLDIGRSYFFRAKDSGKKISQSLYIYQSELNKSKKGYSTDLDKAHRRASKALKSNIEEARKDYLAALNLGVPEKELRRITFNMKIGSYKQKRITKAILTGEFPAIDKETGKLIFD